MCISTRTISENRRFMIKSHSRIFLLSLMALILLHHCMDAIQPNPTQATCALNNLNSLVF